MKKEVIPYIKTLAGDTETPITLYYKYVGEEIGFLLESRGGNGAFSFMGKKPHAILKGKNVLEVEEKGNTEIKKGRLLENVRTYMQQFSVTNTTDIPFIGGAVGVIAYDMIRQYETLPEKNPDILQLPDVHFMVATEVIAYDHLHDKIYLIALDEDTDEGKQRANEKLKDMEQAVMRQIPAVLYQEGDKKDISVKSNTTKERYIKMVKKAKRYIYEGDIFQVVLSQRLTAKIEESPLMLYRKLRTMNPSPYLYYFNFGEYQIAGSSPEKLVEVRGQRVYTCPIAGTRKRGRDVEEDGRLAAELKNDPKERAEHVMLVDLARNDMGRISEIGSVEVTQFMKVQNYSHVMHIVSLVEGNKRKEMDAFSILSAFLPAGTLSGAPKIRAMEIIEELEEEKRGIYGGAAGYFTFDGNMDFCIAIRTMIIHNQKVYMQSGAGIVADSDPELEYEECHNKVRALVKTIGGDL